MKRRRTKGQVPPQGMLIEGISALPAAQTLLRAKKDAQAIFSMVTEERGSWSELTSLVRHDSILQLIFMCIDLTKSSRARVSALKSRKVAMQSRQASLQALHAWLDTNIHRYKGRLELCSIDAAKVPGIYRSAEWIRKEITAYRASHPKR